MTPALTSAIKARRAREMIPQIPIMIVMQYYY